MPIINNQNSATEWNCTFYYSAPLEMLASLHVMADPDHHLSCRDWARRKYQALSGNLKKEIDFFSQNYAQWLFIMDIASELSNEENNVSDMVKRIEKLDNVDFAYVFLGLEAFNFDKCLLESWFKDPDSVTKEDLGIQAGFFKMENIIYFLKNTDEIKKRLIWVIKQYWEEMFYKEWDAIKAYEESVARREKIILDRSNPIDYIQNLSKKLIVENGELIYRKDPDFSIEIEKIKSIVIILSVFAEPHFYGNIIGDKALVCMNLNFHSVKLNESVPRGFLDITNAVSDTTRLKIIRILWNGDTTTKELSEILNLSPSTISLHLKVLREADLIESNKVKKFVYYKLIKEPFYLIQKDLIEYLEY
ncbi:MAG: metalloregulator ArsR/SmtB family transcription factor [Clostridiaceae bacterium]|jgi:DNA-binding transcriptional ArsR family regulator|nr:metalloregulator ArsR/SmtB family transcription factor [Clostridiaceae bacterium]